MRKDGFIKLTGLAHWTAYGCACRVCRTSPIVAAKLDQLAAARERARWRAVFVSGKLNRVPQS
jgi:hypothetical protein